MQEGLVVYKILKYFEFDKLFTSVMRIIRNYLYGQV